MDSSERTIMTMVGVLRTIDGERGRRAINTHKAKETENEYVKWVVGFFFVHWRRWNDIDQSVMSDIKQPFGYIKSTVRCSVTAVSCNSIHNHNDYCCATSRNENSFEWLVAEKENEWDEERREKPSTKTSNMRFVTLLWLHCAAIKPKRPGQLELDEEHASEGDQHSVERQWVKSDRKKRKRLEKCRVSDIQNTTMSWESERFLINFWCFFIVCTLVRVSVFVSLHYFLLVLIVVVVVALVFVLRCHPVPMREHI